MRKGSKHLKIASILVILADRSAGIPSFYRAACSVLPERQRDRRDRDQHHSACNPILLSA